MNPWASESLAQLEVWQRRTGVGAAELERVRAGLTLSLDREKNLAGLPQQPELYLPGLAAAAWWSPDRFPWLSDLEAAYPAIKEEFLAVSAPKTMPHPSGLADEGHWNAYYFYYVGEPNKEHLTECPVTASVLAGIPGIQACGMTYFSVMDPHTHIEPHAGFINAHLRCHLALEIPPDCRMRVGDEVRTWKEGEAFVFDDTYDHEVWNDSDVRRVVLLLDTWHPDLTSAEIDALSHLVNVWRRMMYRQALMKRDRTAHPAG